jgi:hypothetical protein
MIVLECAALILSHGGLCYLPTSAHRIYFTCSCILESIQCRNCEVFLTNFYTVTVGHNNRCLTLFCLSADVCILFRMFASQAEITLQLTSL